MEREKQEAVENLGQKSQFQGNLPGTEQFGVYSPWTRGACQKGSGKI